MHKGTSRKKALRKNAPRKGPSRALAPKKSAKERSEQDQVLGAILNDGFCRQMKPHIDRIRAKYPASRSTLRKAEISRTLSWYIRNQYRQQRLSVDSRCVAQGQRYVLRRINTLARKTKSATPSAKQRGGSADLNSLMTTDRRALSGSIAMMHEGNEDIVPINEECDGCLSPEIIAEARDLLNGRDNLHHPKEMIRITALPDDSNDWPSVRCK